MKAIRAGRIWIMINRSISEISNGHITDLFEYLSYSLGMLLRGIDLQLVLPEEVGLSEERAYWSSNSGGPMLERILDTLSITSNDSIIDIGCGKGGALITMKKYPFRKLSGIELSHELIKTAKDNFNRLRIDDIALHCCDAGSFSDYDDFNYIYMYNPFPCHVMTEVLANISDSLSRLPREMHILYRNPSCHETIMKSSIFEYVVTFDLPLANHQLSIYRHNATDTFSWDYSDSPNFLPQ